MVEREKTYADHERGLSVVRPRRVQHLQKAPIISGSNLRCDLLEVLIHDCVQTVIKFVTVFVKDHVVRVTERDENGLGEKKGSSKER